MKFGFVLILVLSGVSLQARGASRSVQGMEMDSLISELLRNNPEIQAALHQVSAVEARIPQAGSLADPELMYMREKMPGFRFNKAEMQKIELGQMIRFPGKLSLQSDLAKIQAVNAQQLHHEKIQEVLARLKTAYAKLWFFQESQVLNRENARLLEQFARVAQTKYTVGEAAQQDVLRAYVEIAKLDNQLTVLRQGELSAKAELMAVLNRLPEDTLGVARLPQELVKVPGLDTLRQLALVNRPLLLSDSLAVEESRAMLALAKREYIPDFKVGLEYVTAPAGDFRGWTVKAGITLPFAPWTLGKAGGRVEEATASTMRATAALRASRNAVLSSVQDLHYKAQSGKTQIEKYRMIILPQARQSLQASTIGYQTGKTDFLTLIDAFRTLVDLEVEELLLRTEFEQTLAELGRVVGSSDFEFAKQ